MRNANRTVANRNNENAMMPRCFIVLNAQTLELVLSAGIKKITKTTEMHYFTLF